MLTCRRFKLRFRVYAPINYCKERRARNFILLQWELRRTFSRSGLCPQVFMQISCEFFLCLRRRAEGGGKRLLPATGLLLVMALMLTACRDDAPVTNANAPAANRNGNQAVTATAPPFSTQEPPRYRARIVQQTTFANQTSTPLAGVGGLLRRETLVARDGEKKRLELERVPGTGVRIVYLYLPAGSYALLPAAKIYAALKPESSGAKNSANANAANDSGAFEKLLNEQLPGTTYQKIGAENVNGRAATKWVGRTVNAEQNIASETTIWVDDALGIPIRQETTDGRQGTKLTIEYLDISTEVDAGLFALPTDYRSVPMKELDMQALNLASAGAQSKR